MALDVSRTGGQPASELVQFWNEILEPKFTKYRHVLVDGLSLHSEAIFPKLEVPRGGAVLDVGCGFGDTALKLGERVGPDGVVLGVDCVPGFLEAARADAAEAGARNVSFEAADVENAEFERSFDFAFSRFGTMFFGNPVAGLRNIRQALKPGATFVMIVWRTIEDNPWVKLAKDVTLEHLPAPGEDARTCGPGPFSMANEEMVRGQLKAAGFSPDVAFERVDAPIRIGRDVQDAIGFQLALGPAGEIYREAGERAEWSHDMLVADLTRTLTPYLKDDGVYLSSSSWMIAAKAPL